MTFGLSTRNAEGVSQWLIKKDKSGVQETFRNCVSCYCEAHTAGQYKIVDAAGCDNFD